MAPPTGLGCFKPLYGRDAAGPLAVGASVSHSAGATCKAPAEAEVGERFGSSWPRAPLAEPPPPIHSVSNLSFPRLHGFHSLHLPSFVNRRGFACFVSPVLLLHRQCTASSRRRTSMSLALISLRPHCPSRVFACVDSNNAPLLSDHHRPSFARARGEGVDKAENGSDSLCCRCRCCCCCRRRWGIRTQGPATHPPASGQPLAEPGPLITGY